MGSKALRQHGEDSHQAGLVFAGMLTLDLVQVADLLPEHGEKGFARASYFDVGGPAANAAITAAILGGDASLLTVLGVGPLSDYAGKVLDGHGVAVHDHAPVGAIPPVSSIWVDQTGERTILATGGAGVETLPVPGPQVARDAAAALIDGHYPGIALAVTEAAAASSIPVVLDCGRWRPVYQDLLPAATDIIMCASFRSPELAGLSPAETVAEIAARWQPELCAMTRGAESILVADRDAVVELPVGNIAAMDTLGAGDVLHGAYMYYRYAEGREPVIALQAAAALATSTCEHHGARHAVEAARSRR